LQDLLTNRQTK